MESKKYELLDNDFIFFGRDVVFGRDDVKLYRIRALRDIAEVARKGELGGYIEREANLSQDGAAWVDGKAKVYGHALVSGDALVDGSAAVCGSVQILGDAHVRDRARLSGDVVVTDQSTVCGDAILYGNVHISGHAAIDGNTILSGTVKVGDHAMVRQRAIVDGDALIGGYAHLRGEARVTGGVFAGDAVVGGQVITKPNARISTRADICFVDVSDEHGVLTGYRTEQGVFTLTFGLFEGSPEELCEDIASRWDVTDVRARLLFNFVAVIEQHFTQ